MDGEEWNKLYLEQEEAEEKETLRLVNELAAAERAAIVQRYNFFAGQLRELVPKLLEFYEEKPPRDHDWLEIEGKKIVSWLLVSDSPVKRRDWGIYLDLYNLYLLADGRIALYCRKEDPNEPGGERVRHYRREEFFRFIKLDYEGDIDLINYTETAHEYINILESACKYIQDTIEAPERERQAKIAAEEQAQKEKVLEQNKIEFEKFLEPYRQKVLLEERKPKALPPVERQAKIAAEKQAQKEVEERRERLKSHPIVTVGKPENTIFLNQPQQKEQPLGFRFGKNVMNAVQAIYEISVEMSYILFGALISVLLVITALYFLGSDHPLLSIIFCASALYVFIRIATKRFKHKKVDTLFSQYWTRKLTKLNGQNK